MSNNDQETRGFGDTSFSWKAYDQYRPPYPPSVWSLIFSYHQSHGAQLTAALDVGCGSGAASTTLAKHFSAVKLVDPSEHNLEAAKARLGSEAFKSSLPRPCEITYSVLPAEESAVPPASQDMVTIFETIHWTDAPKAMDQAARALKPGGTLALVHYGPRCRILDNPHAEHIWNDFWLAWTKATCQPDTDETHIRGIGASNTGLKHVLLDAGVWEHGARRIRINCGFKEEAAMPMADADDVPMAENHVQAERESLKEIERETDWDMLVEPEWFKNLSQTCQSSTPLPHDFDEKTAGLWRDLNKALDNGPKENGKVRITWPVDVVLATRI
ncbi:hypothetical protein G7Y79_00010g028290 [Physcia stellaris]|nr:hypothetical protein G7Y79_00010g028290 [Physcia stellaris]